MHILYVNINTNYYHIIYILNWKSLNNLVGVSLVLLLAHTATVDINVNLNVVQYLLAVDMLQQQWSIEDLLVKHWLRALPVGSEWCPNSF